MIKLYFYILKMPFNKEPYIECKECEVVNKPKTYKPVGKFPRDYYGCYVRKDDIGNLIGYSHNIVILMQDDYETAAKLFKDYINKNIKGYDHQIENLKKYKMAVDEFLKNKRGIDHCDRDVNTETKKMGIKKYTYEEVVDAIDNLRVWDNYNSFQDAVDNVLEMFENMELRKETK